jgi:hypothetical protein
MLRSNSDNQLQALEKSAVSREIGEIQAKSCKPVFPAIDL